MTCPYCKVVTTTDRCPGCFYLIPEVIEMEEQLPFEKRFEKFFPLFKVDESTHTVTGMLADESTDRTGESMDYDRSKPNFQEWSSTQAKATNGKSWGNVREMHSLNAVGKFTNINYDDQNKRITGTAEIVDPLCWTKITRGVLSGFSIGGEYQGGLKPEKAADGSTRKRYIAKVTECSVVDLPCNANATFDYVKADGTTELRKFHSLQKEVIDMTAEETEVLVKDTITSMIADGTLVKGVPKELKKEEVCPDCKKPLVDGKCECGYVAKVAGPDTKLCPTCQKPTEGEAVDKCKCSVAKTVRERPTDVSMAHAVTVILAKALQTRFELTGEQVEKVFENSMTLKLEKGLNQVSRLAQILLDLAWLKWSVQQEQGTEGDKESPLPAALQEDVSNLANTLIELTGEETKELVEQLASGEMPDQASAPSPCAPIGFCRAMDDEMMRKLYTDGLGTFSVDKTLTCNKLYVPETEEVLEKGSGNFGHSGRPGSRGGSGGDSAPPEIHQLLTDRGFTHEPNKPISNRLNPGYSHYIHNSGHHVSVHSTGTWQHFKPSTSPSSQLGPDHEGTGDDSLSRHLNIHMLSHYKVGKSYSPPNKQDGYDSYEATSKPPFTLANVDEMSPVP